MGRDGRGWTIKDLWTDGRASGRRWRVRVWCNDAESVKTRHFPSGDEQEAKAWGRTQAARFHAGIDTVRRCLLDDVGAEYVAGLEQAGLRSGHVNEVRRVYKEVVAAGGNDMNAPSFPMKVREWIGGISVHERFINRAESKNGDNELSALTKNRYLLHIRSIAKYAVEANYLNRNPLLILKNHKVQKVAMSTFSVAECMKLVDPAQAQHPYWVAIHLLIYTGCRAGEALFLKWQNVDWHGKRIWVKLPEPCDLVTIAKRKNKPERQDMAYRLKRDKERWVPLQPELEAVLLPMKQEAGYIVPAVKFKGSAVRSHLDKTRWTQLRAYVADCGINPLDRHPHSTRHTWVSMMLATGEDVFTVMETAGHESLLTTQGYSRSMAAMKEAVKGWKKGEFELKPKAT